MSSGDRTPYEVLAVRLGMAGQALTGNCNIEHAELFRLMEKYGKPRGGGMEAALLAAEERIIEREAQLDASERTRKNVSAALVIAKEWIEQKDARIRALEECLRDLIETESSEIASWHEARTLLAAEKREDERNG